MNEVEHPAPISLVVAEPLPRFLDAILEEFQQPDMTVLATATTGIDAVRAIHEHRPTVAMIAQQFRDITGIEVLLRTRETAPILFYTQADSPEIVFESMMMGARGYLLKWFVEIDLPWAIRRVASGGIVMGSGSLDLFIKAVELRLHTHRIPVGVPVLSEREREIIGLIGQGHRRPNIAVMLGLQESTVRTHLRNAYAKLGVSSQAHAVIEAIRLGEIGPIRARQASQSDLIAPHS